MRKTTNPFRDTSTTMTNFYRGIMNSAPKCILKKLKNSNKDITEKNQIEIITEFIWGNLLPNLQTLANEFDIGKEWEKSIVNKDVTELKKLVIWKEYENKLNFFWSEMCQMLRSIELFLKNDCAYLAGAAIVSAISVSLVHYRTLPNINLRERKMWKEMNLPKLYEALV